MAEVVVMGQERSKDIRFVVCSLSTVARSAMSYCSL